MVKTVTVAAAVLVIPVAALTACQTNQPSNQQTTSPATSPAGPPPGTERMTTQLKTANGTPVANATLDFANGFATVTVETVGAHILSPGFHGLHIHSVGKCEANSVAPTGGAPADFNSAGGHFQVPGHTGQPHSGDLTSLQVRSDGSAKLVTTTNSFTAADLRAGQGTALMIHQNSDNFGNIPPERYTQRNGTPGPDQETLSTGDAGPRVACGVLAPPTGPMNTTTTTTTTTVETTPAGAPPPAGTVTTTPPSPSPTGTGTVTGTVTTTTTETTTPSPAEVTTTTTTPPPGPPPGGG